MELGHAFWPLAYASGRLKISDWVQELNAANVAKLFAPVVAFPLIQFSVKEIGVLHEW